MPPQPGWPGIETVTVPFRLWNRPGEGLKLAIVELWSNGKPQGASVRRTSMSLSQKSQNFKGGFMRRVLRAGGFAVAAVAACLILNPSVVSAQFLGQVSTARTTEQGANDMGGFLGVYDQAMALFGQYRRGFSPSGDFGILAGFYDPKGENARLTVGGDIKFQVFDDQKNDPFDLALDSRLALIDIPNGFLFSVGESAVFSHDFKISRGSVLAPYGAVNLRLEHFSSHTEWEVAAAGGLRWEVSDLIDAYGELVIDNDLGLVMGLNFKL